MSNSELSQKITDKYADTLNLKDVKGVISTLADLG